MSAPAPQHSDTLSRRRRAQAERALIGALLLDGEAFVRVSNIVSEQDFVEHRNRKIYAVARHLHDRGAAIDSTTVAAELERFGALADAGLEYLADLVEETVTAVNIEAYAEIVAGNTLSAKAKAECHWYQ